MKLTERETCINGHDLRVPGAISINAQNVFFCRACAKEAQAKFRAMYRPGKRENVRRTQTQILEDNARKAVMRNNARIEALEAKIGAMFEIIEELRADNARIEATFLGGE